MLWWKSFDFSEIIWPLYVYQPICENLFSQKTKLRVILILQPFHRSLLFQCAVVILINSLGKIGNYPLLCSCRSWHFTLLRLFQIYKNINIRCLYSQISASAPQTRLESGFSDCFFSFPQSFIGVLLTNEPIFKTEPWLYFDLIFTVCTNNTLLLGPDILNKTFFALLISQKEEMSVVSRSVSVRLLSEKPISARLWPEVNPNDYSKR